MTHPLHPPAEFCSCDKHDLERRQKIAAMASALQARFAARENYEWDQLKEKSLSRPMARVVYIATRRVRKVVSE